MAKTNIKFNNKSYSIENSLLADATARLEAHLISMMDDSEVLEGDGQEFHKFAPAALTFRSTAPLSELQEVQINGVAIDPANYTTEEGSTVITLPIEYLKTLDADNYEISVISASKSVSGGFSVVEPDLNEHGFYYNQPYTAHVPMFGENESVFIREDGTLDIIGTPSGSISNATYSVSGNIMTILSPIVGTLTGTISEDGIFINELATNFVLTSDDSIAADDDYIYIYKEDLSGYEVKAIDKTKAEYGAIKTGINGIPTVKLVDEMFGDRTDGLYKLNVAPIMPDSVTHIGKQAFYSCYDLKSVIIGNGVVSIGEKAFQHCFALTNIVIPNSVTTIGESAFSGCKNLASVTIGQGVVSIGYKAFECFNLSEITFNGTIAQWVAIEKEDYWNTGVPATHVHCIDGDVAL